MMSYDDAHCLAYRLAFSERDLRGLKYSVIDHNGEWGVLVTKMPDYKEEEEGNDD
ncbi:MAG: hypothetical protein Ta2A_11570 [Treponemataceae bacterium]|nr:MAG: hypothetical protein Ta2A_11570 [Treponemataceae bacterium]